MPWRSMDRAGNGGNERGDGQTRFAYNSNDSSRVRLDKNLSVVMFFLLFDAFDTRSSHQWVIIRFLFALGLDQKETVHHLYTCNIRRLNKNKS